MGLVLAHGPLRAEPLAPASGPAAAEGAAAEGAAEGAAQAGRPLRSPSRAAAEELQNVISYNAAISACQKGQQWQRALELLGERCGPPGSRPTVISYRASE